MALAIKFTLLCYLMCLAPLASAHKYFFAITDVNYNTKNQHLEVIHQITLHDLDLLLKDQLSAEDFNNKSTYELALKAYINQHFQIFADNYSQALPLNWAGYEISFGQLIIYQESGAGNLPSNYTINNSLLVDNFPKQINTVNYSIANKFGSLTFNSKIQKLVIPVQ